MNGNLPTPEGKHDRAASGAHPELYAPNMWPDNDDDFREAYTKMGRLCHAVGEALLRGVARSFDLDPDALSDLARGAPHVLRALRYLPLDDAQAASGLLWGEEHTDFNLLTSSTIPACRVPGRTTSMACSCARVRRPTVPAVA
jgi:isopenicillin N synthase-like dioxygenase